MFNENGWYNTDDKEFQEAFRTFLEPLIKGHISASDFYSSTELQPEKHSLVYPAVQPISI